MKKQLNFLLFILFLVIIAWLFSPSKETRDKLWVLKGVALAQPYQAAVAEYVGRTGELPSATDLDKQRIKVDVNLDKTAVDAIHIGQQSPGVVSIYYSSEGSEAAPKAIDNTSLHLIPSIEGKHMAWSCRTDIPDNLSPRGCD